MGEIGSVWESISLFGRVSESLGEHFIGAFGSVLQPLGEFYIVYEKFRTFWLVLGSLGAVRSV